MESGYGNLKQVTPFSAWVILWGVFTWFQFCEQMRRVDRKYGLNSWAWFVPLYFNLYLKNVNNTMNQLIDDKRLKNVQKLGNSTFLNLFLPLAPLYSIFQRWNDIVDGLQGK